jgi:agmatine deiminase
MNRNPGLRVPADWEPRLATLLAWPGVERRDLQKQLVEFYCQLITRLRRHEPVWLLVPPDEKVAIAALLGGEDESLHLEPLLTNDLWMRDAAPISAVDRQGRTVFLDGNFNGWGGKYPHELDRLIPNVLARRLGVERVRLPMTVEGGAIEVNGRGDLLTTESVLLNPNRNNPDRDKVESVLQTFLGIEHVHWLSGGLSGDDTDGHIDNLARFVAPDHLVCLSPDLPANHPDRRVLADNHARLQAMQLVSGRPRITELPLPEVFGRDGRRLPASYANFHMAPGVVLVPQFGHNADQEALSELASVFPNDRVEGLDCRPLLELGGTLHCICQPLRLEEVPES